MEIIDINQKSDDHELNHMQWKEWKERNKVRNVAQTESRALSSGFD